MSAEKLRELKKNFQAMDASARDKIIESFHKINLGVNEDEDITRAMRFFGPVSMELKPEKLQLMIQFLLSDSSHPPAQLILEESVTEVEHLGSEPTDKGLPSYNEDELETLREDFKPFK